MKRKGEQGPGDGELSPFMMWVARQLGKIIPKGYKEDFKRDAENLIQAGAAIEGVHAPASADEAAERRTQLLAERCRNAQAALDLVYKIYRPEVTMARVAERMREEGKPDRQIELFEEVYIGEANDRLHAHPGPVIIGEQMRAPLRGGGDICGHCGGLFFGRSRITGAHDPKDLTLVADRYEGLGFEETVKVARDPRNTVFSIEYTALEEHRLIYHHGSDEAVATVDKLRPVAAYFLDPHAEPLEHPRFAADAPLPPEVV